MIRYFLSPTLTLYVTDGEYYTEVSYFAETYGDVCERAEQRLTKPQDFSSVFPYHPQHFAYEITPEQYYSKENKNLLKIQGRMHDDDATNYVRCAYCGCDIAEENNTAPKAWDDDAWEKLSKEHADDCDWINTRAHQIS